MYKLSILGPCPIAKVDPGIYGHFTEHIGGVVYDGIWVGEDSDVPNVRGIRKSITDDLRAINSPVIRWPGGCFAETYDWRDGIGPRDQRPVRRNWWHANDKRLEPNAFGTHEFIDFCRQAGSEPYIAANITTLDPSVIRDWVEYCNDPAGTTTLSRRRAENGSADPFNVRYWGVGNETWGGGGNMTAEMYAHEYRKYSVIMDNACEGLTLIASGANHADWKWVRDLLNTLEPSEKHMAGLSLHFYCGTTGLATEFSDGEYYKLLRQAADIEQTIDRNWGFIVGFGMEKQARLVIDEWGCWHKPGSGPSAHLRESGIAPAINNPDLAENLFEQQSTMRDAVVTALTLNIFNNNADKVQMACVAQLVNNLHCLFLSGHEHFIRTPTYYVFDLFKSHMNGTALRVSCDCGDIELPDGKTLPKVSASASVLDGVLTVTLANLSIDSGAEVDLRALGFELEHTAEFGVLSSGDARDHNTFENPDKVKARYSSGEFDGKISVPAAGIVMVKVKIAGRF